MLQKVALEKAKQPKKKKKNVHPSGSELVFHWVLICIFLMTNDIEYLFMRLLASVLLLS